MALELLLCASSFSNLPAAALFGNDTRGVSSRGTAQPLAARRRTHLWPVGLVFLSPTTVGRALSLNSQVRLWRSLWSSSDNVVRTSLSSVFCCVLVKGGGYAFCSAN